MRLVPIAAALVVAGLMSVLSPAAEAGRRGAVPGHHTQVTGPQGGVTRIDRTRGADGLVDRQVVGAGGRTSSTDRYYDPAGNVDTTHVGRRGGVGTLDRTRGADGLTDRVVTGPGGRTSSIDRYRDDDGSVDALRTGPNGGTTTIDRTRLCRDAAGVVIAC